VSREMFQDLRLGPSIGSVTNGVHARTWIAGELQQLFDERLAPGWDLGDAAAWDQVTAIGDDDLREVFSVGRRRLVDMIANRAATTAKLDPNALTIGFARRFATYKRASLLLNELDSLIALLADSERPVQFVFAGKAHPADEPGKALLAQINEFALHPASRGRFVFVPDYDIEVAQVMYAGCDVWLNNPVRPLEACGTSGMKAALNGALNCSIRDGWWDELYEPVNGWAIPTSDDPDPAARDLEEARALMALVSDEIVPLFYRQGSRSPAWLGKVREAWRSLGAQVTAARMVSEYRDRFYT
jgi:starch phosphorylase